MCLPPQEDIWAAFSSEVIQEKLFLALRARVEKNNFAKQMSLPWRRECKSIFGGAQCLIKKCCIWTELRIACTMYHCVCTLYKRGFVTLILFQCIDRYPNIQFVGFPISDRWLYPTMGSSALYMIVCTVQWVENWMLLSLYKSELFFIRTYTMITAFSSLPTVHCKVLSCRAGPPGFRLRQICSGSNSNRQIRFIMAVIEYQ